MEALVVDASPLAHFARAGWLGVLKALVGSHRAVIPVQVVGLPQVTAEGGGFEPPGP